jgi:hypothetical protein
MPIPTIAKVAQWQWAGDHPARPAGRQQRCENRDKRSRSATNPLNARHGADEPFDEALAGGYGK